jgi:hypothetical protein
MSESFEILIAKTNAILQRHNAPESTLGAYWMFGIWLSMKFPIGFHLEHEQFAKYLQILTEHWEHKAKLNAGIENWVGFDEKGNVQIAADVKKTDKDVGYFMEVSQCRDCRYWKKGVRCSRLSLVAGHFCKNFYYDYEEAK